MAQPKIKTIELCLRQAELADFERIRSFYENNLHENLPPPPSKDIADTIAEDRVLILEDLRKETILACGAIFRLSPVSSKTYVGELAGMRALCAVRGLRPFSAQTLLIGARLLGHAATDAEPGRGRTNSLVTIVKKGNERSKNNIEAACFRPLTQRPAWIRYDELAWHGSIVSDEWSYYYATNETVRHVAKLLVEKGLLQGEMLLTRTNRTTGEDEQFRIHSQLRDIVNSAGDVHRLLRGQYQIQLCSPPERLVF
jgi:hypothetical protein